MKVLQKEMDTSQTNQFLPEQSIMITNSQGTWFSKFSKFGEKLTINTSVDKNGSKKWNNNEAYYNIYITNTIIRYLMWTYQLYKLFRLLFQSYCFCPRFQSPTQLLVVQSPCNATRLKNRYHYLIVLMMKSTMY